MTYNKVCKCKKILCVCVYSMCAYVCVEERKINAETLRDVPVEFRHDRAAMDDVPVLCLK